MPGLPEREGGREEATFRVDADVVQEGRQDGDVGVGGDDDAEAAVGCQGNRRRDEARPVRVEVGRGGSAVRHHGGVVIG